jgi:hypothetical protein
MAGLAGKGSFKKITGKICLLELLVQEFASRRQGSAPVIHKSVVP